MDCVVRIYPTCPVPQKVFTYLDARSLGNCRLVASHWKECIDSLKCWHRSRLEGYEKKLLFDLNNADNGLFRRLIYGKVKLNITEKFPQWKPVIDHFKFNANFQDLRDFATNMVDYFENDKKNFNPLHNAIVIENIPFILLLLQSPLDFGARDQDGLTALHLACLHGSKAVLELLLKVATAKGIDINLESGKLESAI